MSMICQKDARMSGFDFVFRALFMDTYSEFGVASRLDFDPFGFSECQARRLCQAFGLNRALILILIFHFFTLFSILVWPSPAV